MPGAAILTIDGSTTSSGPANPQDLNRFAYVTNNPLRFTDPTGHCGKATFGDTAMSVMSGDCTRRAYEAFTRADTTEGKVVSGAVMAASAIGAGAGWVGGILLAAAGGQAIAGAVAGSTTASTAAGSAATAACADGNCGNEASAAAATVSRAAAPLAKFQDYLFKPGATHGKDVIFRSLGYGSEHSQQLVKLYEEQALTKYQHGAYTLGKLDQYGQRINITIDLPGIGDAVGKTRQIISGWMIRSDGSITLNTPFSGFPK